MTFDLDPDKDLFEANPSLKNFREFKPFKERQEILRWIFFMYDYDTPYRRIPLEQRKVDVGLNVGFETRKTKSGFIFKPEYKKVIKGEDPEVVTATEKFKEFQFDDDRDLLQVYDEQIAKIKAIVREADHKANDMTKINKMLVEDIPKIRKSKKDLMEMLDIRKEDIIEDDEEVSALEKQLAQ